MLIYIRGLLVCHMTCCKYNSLLQIQAFSTTAPSRSALAVAFPIWGWCACRFQLPEGLQLANLLPLAAKASSAAQEGLLQARDTSGSGSGLVQLFTKEVDDSLTWEILPWLKKVTKLPVFVKVSGASVCTCARDERLADVPASKTGQILPFRLVAAVGKCREVTVLALCCQLSLWETVNDVLDHHELFRLQHKAFLSNSQRYWGTRNGDLILPAVSAADKVHDNWPGLDTTCSYVISYSEQYEGAQIWRSSLACCLCC
jgi:hypothetical protein